MPHTELDGQILDFDNVKGQVKDIAEKQRTRWVSDKDLELSKKALARKDKVSITK